MSAIITLDNVTVKYGNHTALQEVSGNFPAGSLTAVAGPNGSGKSTMLKIIAGILKPSQGKVSVSAGAGDVAYLPQTQTVHRDFPMLVEQAAATGLYPQWGDGAGITPLHRKVIASALAEVGLAGKEKRQIAELSGGEFQRLMFARVILQDAKIILLDEPFASIDAETTAKLIQILLKWHREGRTIICVLHDLLLIQKFFPQAMVLAGKCLGRGHTHQLFEQKLLSFDLDMAEICTDETHIATHKHDHDHDCGHDHA
jgi:zinc/manganese transport system ATP-binding protein